MLKKQLIELSSSIYNGKYDYSLVPNTFKTKEKLPIVCPEHGTFFKTYEKHIGCRQGCPECIGRRRYTTEEFIEKAKKLSHTEKYDFSNTSYVNNRTHIEVICSEHGSFKIKPGHLLSGEGCPKCRYIKSANTKRRTIDEVVKLSRDVHGKKYDYSLITFYKNDREKYPIICPEHGVFLQSFNNHIKGGRGCPKCGILKCSQHNNLTTNEFITKANERHNFKYDYSKSVYTGSKNNILIICPEHGEFQQIARNHIFGAGCPKCFKDKSNIEKEILEFIKDIAPNLKIIENDRIILSGQEIDIYVPDLNIGFEVNGLIWHSEKFNDNKFYHLNKTLKCLDKGIKLYHIFEDEWNFKNEICKSNIKHLLKVTSEKIYTKDCTIGMVAIKEQRDFLNKNHIQGYTPSKYAIGLYYNSNLVSIMTFKEKHIMSGLKYRENEYELLRFCSLKNYIVINSAKYLFEYFVKTYVPTKIVTYIDRRWSFGELYEELGFSNSGSCKPNYFYVINKERIKKYNFTKSKLVKNYYCSNSITERDFCRAQGWYRIYDCGALKYIWKSGI